jgi:hypothetical protein
METAVIRSKALQMLIVALLVLLGMSVRVMPHPANVAPLMAIALYSSVMLPRRIAPWVPVGAAVLSDSVLGFYDIMPVVWACYALVAYTGVHYMRRAGVVQGIVLTCSASLLFFVVTNFAVWLSSGMYAHTISGLVTCYGIAVPFFRASIFGDLLYTSALFGATAVIRGWMTVHSLRAERAL